MKRPWPALGRSATKKEYVSYRKLVKILKFPFRLLSQHVNKEVYYYYYYYYYYYHHHHHYYYYNHYHHYYCYYHYHHSYYYYWYYEYDKCDCNKTTCLLHRNVEL